MRRRARMFAALMGTAMVALLVSAGSASASFHEMKIRAIFEGPVGASFVELQMYADGQNLVNGQTIDVYHNGSATKSTYVLGANVSNAGNQRTILIGDNATLNPDFNTGGGLSSDLHSLAGAGAVCYSGIDCASWGSFNNNAVLPTPAGTPMSALSTNMVVARTIARGCSTALDTADDTDNTAADFSFVQGAFPVRNNAGVPTETLCPTSTPPPATKKKCKKPKKSATSAKKKKCKKKKHHR
jgi:hypothetical protein